MASKTKVKLMKASGLPIDETKVVDFQNEYRDRFDVLFKEYEKDMIKFNEEEEKLLEELRSKYEVFKEVPLPTSKKAWSSMRDEYGAGLLVTQLEANKETVIVIMDQGI